MDCSSDEANLDSKLSLLGPAERQHRSIVHGWDAEN